MYDDITGFYDEIFPLNHAFLKFIPNYLEKSGSRILDLGCGPGDYVDELTRSGYIATGIDSSSEMIRRAKSQKQGAFIKYSFTEIEQLEDSYDCIFSIGNSLSYLPTDLLQPFFNDVFQLMNSSGFFVMQVVNWDKYFRTGSMNFEVKTLSDGRTFHRSYKLTSELNVIFHTELRKGKEIQNSWSDMLYPKLVDDLISKMQESGFVVHNKFGDFGHSDFDSLSSPATILVAKKPD
jgi:cyclopropane fatty-acyl-phospholipid synthase-like methyltransferase